MHKTIFLWAAWTVVFSSCAPAPVSPIPPSSSASTATGPTPKTGLLGYTHVDGQAMTYASLANDTTKTHVFIFSSRLCLDCQDEAREINTAYKKEMPKIIRFHSVITQADVAQANTWFAKHGVIWDRGIDGPNNEFLNYVCGNGSKVPCTVIVKNKAVVHRVVGKISLEDIKKYAGGW